MNPLEALLIDLVQMAETPLYSAYRWIGKQLGHDVSLTEFLHLVDDLLERDVLQLWSVDQTSHDRTELSQVPEQLEFRYRELGHLEDSFDPFGFSITLGGKALVESKADWEIDLDLNQGRFTLKAKPGADPKAWAEISRYFPDLQFEPQQTHGNRSEVEISGTVRSTA